MYIYILNKICRAKDKLINALVFIILSQVLHMVSCILDSVVVAEKKDVKVFIGSSQEGYTDNVVYPELLL